MPYLNFETSNRRHNINLVIRECHQRNIDRGKCPRLEFDWTDSGLESISSNPKTFEPESSHDKLVLRDDKMLIRAYLKNTSRSLHPRRTLDQFYYYMLDDTEKRDLDQVVERWVRSNNNHQSSTEPEANSPNIFMVDQLWLWVVRGRENTPITSDTVITCFPQRWGQSTEEDVLQNLLNYLVSTDRAPIASVYDLVDVITTYCSNVFDRSRVPKDLQFQEFFENYIGRVVSETSD